jgi:hypothetical protein
MTTTESNLTLLNSSISSYDDITHFEESSLSLTNTLFQWLNYLHYRITQQIGYHSPFAVRIFGSGSCEITFSEEKILQLSLNGAIITVDNAFNLADLLTHSQLIELHAHCLQNCTVTQILAQITP